MAASSIFIVRHGLASATAAISAYLLQMLKMVAAVHYHNCNGILKPRRRALAKSIALSTFDSVKGPVMHFFVTDGFVDEGLKEEISSMISVKVSTDYFLVRMNNISCFNKQFNIKSGTARGKVEMLMISLVTDKFPTRAAEKFFLKEADDFITFLRSEPYPELVFHLHQDFNEEDFELVEHTYEETLHHLKDTLERFTCA